MARLIGDKDIKATLDAAELWIERCLIGDRAVFSDEALWSAAGISEVRTAFVENLDAGEGTFFDKLRGQLVNASPRAKRLMAEMLWAARLFPSNITSAKKRRQVGELYATSGTPVSLDHALLSDDVLKGIGSAGPGFNNHFWRELVFIVSIVESLKAMPESQRRTVLRTYDSFIPWIDSVPQEGDRQFRHMLRYFAFPDSVERMSSHRERRYVLAAFRHRPERGMKDWDDRRLDEELLKLRRELEARYPGQILDFYAPPLKDQWIREEDPSPEVETPPTAALQVKDSGATISERPVNRIFYGPPGTGKTFLLRNLAAKYTEDPHHVDEGTWLQEVLAEGGWRSIIAVALAERGRSMRVPELRDHKWVALKTIQRGRTPSSVQATIWGYLQEHTSPDSKTVGVAARRPPYIFDKLDSGEWVLVEGWRDLDEVSAELERTLKAGPSGATEPIKRYRAITFHPSYSYEDFVRGIRPVSVGEARGTEFRVVDGVFKRLCDEARANPAKRYALFIDEINRANIAKVFGELISLIEPDKRATYSSDGRLISGMVVQLPGGDKSEGAEAAFGVPQNLDIYGTMNTADRSIALLDVALRRRFEFVEVEPKYRVFEVPIAGVRLDLLLKRLNDRLEFLLDRDHRIGHAYLMGVSSIAELQARFRDQIIPLLQEYFFDDFSRVALVLQTGGTPFVEKTSLVATEIFPSGTGRGLGGQRDRYVITRPEDWSVESFAGIYESVSGPTAPEGPE